MTPPEDAGDLRLRSRILAAAAMIPVALLAAWHSTTSLAALTAIAGVAMALEWARLVQKDAPWPFWFCAGGVVASLVILILGREDWAWGAVIGAALLGAVAARAQDRLTTPIFVGIVVIAGASFGLVWLRNQSPFGLETVLWLFAIVWTTDSMAFATGTMIGGPRLAPSISPRKTWSGALGGFAAAGAVSVVFAQLIGISATWWMLALGLIASCIAQMGDLVESWFKRLYGVKQMSDLIPGHGGVLDRLDGLIAATIFVCLATIWGGTTPLLWM